jgi:hypothetical protein
MKVDATPKLERIKTTLVGLKMPRALEMIDDTVGRLERGELSALEAIDTLLAEELAVRESRRVRTDQNLPSTAIFAVPPHDPLPPGLDRDPAPGSSERVGAGIDRVVSMWCRVL